MGKVPAFHTDSPEYPPENRELHHDNDACYEGKKILPRHKKDGNGGKPPCKVCEGLA
jgi:hypothetical protein